VNVEAFNNWPSADERPFIVATQLPLVGRVVLWLWSFPTMARLALLAGDDVYDKHALSVAQLVRALAPCRIRAPDERREMFRSDVAERRGNIPMRPSRTRPALR
jgi:hypothetical protein